MSFIKPWKLENKKKKGSYLKYEEGEVIPVKSKQSHYPPFLDEDENVKQFKDIRQKEAHRHATKMVENIKENKGNVQKANVPPSSPSSSDSKPPKLPLNHSLIMKLTWLVIIGGLVYYSVPMIRYFSSETPDLPNIEGTVEKTKKTVQESTEQAKQAAGTVTEATREVTGKVSEGAGLVNAVKDNLGGNTASEDSNVAQFSESQWLFIITSTQNQKQENLISLQQYTRALANGEIGQSQYRLLVKGITRKTERLNEKFEENIQGQNLSLTSNVVDALKAELDHLKKVSVSLSSTSEDSVILVFNEEIKIQNTLTEQYKSSLKALLKTYGQDYKEVDGKIIYE